MKKILALVLMAAVVSCNNQDEKDEIAKVNEVKITIDVVAEDFNGTETTSGSSWLILPKN